MNITKNIISDLLPLYMANECSPDTRALVDEYLRTNPEDAAQLRRIMHVVGGPAPTPLAGLEETRALREARRRLRRRSWWLAFAIFFSLAPFSFSHIGDQHWWMLRDSPKSALVYGLVGVLCWVGYVWERRRSGGL